MAYDSWNRKRNENHRLAKLYREVQDWYDCGCYLRDWTCTDGDLPVEQHRIVRTYKTSYWKFLKKKSSRRVRARGKQYLSDYERNEYKLISSNCGYKRVSDVGWDYY